MKSATYEEVSNLLGVKVELNQAIDYFIIERFEFNNEIFVCPPSRFSDFTFGEFIFADMCFIKFTNSKDNYFRDKLCATLYRHERIDFNKQFHLDTRFPFNPILITFFSEKFSKLDESLKNLIVVNFSLLRKWIECQYPDVFKKSDRKTTKPDEEPWLNIRDMLAVNATDIEKIDALQLHDVLFRLNRQTKNG